MTKILRPISINLMKDSNHKIKPKLNHSNPTQTTTSSAKRGNPNNLNSKYKIKFVII